MVVDENGDRLTRIGNMPVSPGDYVWTDGAAVYGFFQDTDEQKPYIPPVSGGILYIDDSTMYRYRRQVYMQYSGGILVDGLAACWVLTTTEAINASTGARCSLSVLDSITESITDACVTDDGDLLIITQISAPAAEETAKIYRAGETLSLIATVDDFSRLDTNLKSMLRGHCPIQPDIESYVSRYITEEAIHPDVSWNMIVRASGTAQCDSPIETSDFTEVYTVYDINSQEAVFESEDAYPLSWAGTRRRTVSGGRWYVFDSGGTFKAIETSWEWRESEYRVSHVNYDISVYTEEDRNNIPAADKDALLAKGFDIDQQALPFELHHSIYAVIPANSASGTNYDTANWALDDTTAQVEGGPDKSIGGTIYTDTGLVWTVSGHQYEGRKIRDEYTTGEVELVVAANYAFEALPGLFEYGQQHSGELTTGGLNNYRVRYCRIISQVKSNLERG